MPRVVITARVSQEQFNKIDKLVSDGIFNNRSAALQHFVELGLEYCTLDESILEVLMEFKTKALVATQRTAICNMAEFIMEELSCLIEMKYQSSIVDSLARIKDLATQLSPELYQWLMEILEAESIYLVAQQLVKEQ